ncbi:MAG TPA: AIPR family protein, partial [Candidatus Binataceae bacterium]|nr:AIPR family protein [Candidatus Binataceae bacterium]
NTATNKEIIRTGRDDPTSFFHLNNGISCLASDFEIDDQNDRVRVTGLQIINGAQTVKSLVKASQDKTWVEEKEPALLVRITEVRAYGSAGQFRERIIRGNNTQNIIKASDFRSNDPVQTDLIRKFAVIHRGGKEVQYVPKRTDRPKPNAITIRLEEFAKAVYSFLCDPVKFSGSTSFLFDDGETGGYRSVFGDGEVVWHFMPEREFRLRSAIWWLSLEFGNRLRDEKKKLDERIGDERDDEKKNEAVLERHALERKWPFIFSAGLLLQQGNRGSGYVDDLLKTYKGDWKFGEGTTGKWFEQIYEKSRKSIVWLYKQASKQPGFEHRNWMRSNSTVASIREFFADAPFDPVTRLPSRAD